MLGMRTTKKIPSGFTLIELMVVTSIIGILAATSVPSYKIYLDKVRLLSGEVELVQALRDFSVLRDYSPPTGLLADLVSEGFMKDIPNDPWTSRSAVNTGAEEDVDWHYINNGETLTLYAYSHPDRKYILPSFGKAPLDSPVVIPVSGVDAAQTGLSAKKEPDKVKKELESDKTKQEPEHDKAKKEVESDKAKKELESDKAKKELESDKAKKELESDKAKKELESDKTKKELGSDRSD